MTTMDSDPTSLNNSVVIWHRIFMVAAYGAKMSILRNALLAGLCELVAYNYSRPAYAVRSIVDPSRRSLYTVTFTKYP